MKTADHDRGLGFQNPGHRRKTCRNCAEKTSNESDNYSQIWGKYPLKRDKIDGLAAESKIKTKRFDPGRCGLNIRTHF